MNYRKIFSATSVYRRLKLLYGFGLTVLFTVLFTIIVGLSSLASTVLAVLLAPVWLALCLFLLNRIYNAIGWKLEAGHLYLITAAFSENSVPEDAFTIVGEILRLLYPQKRYCALRKRIGRAVDEINRSMQKANSLVGDINGLKMMNEVGSLFLKFHLRFMRDCCISYMFMQMNEDPDSSSVNACAFYAINWKKLSERSSDISIFSVAAIAVPTAILGLLLGPVLSLIGLGAYSFYSWILGFMIVLTLKYAYFDTFLDIRCIDRFLQLCARNVPGERCYAQLRKTCPAFAYMMEKAGGHQTPTLPRTAKKRQKARPAPVHSPDPTHPIVCPRCRTANKTDALFCVGCGMRLARSQK